MNVLSPELAALNLALGRIKVAQLALEHLMTLDHVDKSDLVFLRNHLQGAFCEGIASHPLSQTEPLPAAAIH